MNKLTAQLNRVTLLLLSSVAIFFIVTFVSKQVLYLNRNLFIDMEISADHPFKLMTGINGRPGQFGYEHYDFEIFPDSLNRIRIPHRFSNPVKLICFVSEPHNATFYLHRIFIENNYRDMSWSVESLSGKVKSRIVGDMGIDNFTLGKGEIKVALSERAPLFILTYDWSQEFYRELSKDSKIFAVVTALLFFVLSLIFYGNQRKIFQYPFYPLTLTSLFILALIIPFFSQKENESHENRQLAPFPKLNQLIWKIPGEYNKYYNDRFPYRNSLAYINNFIRMKYFRTSPLPNHLRIGKNGWLFLNVEVARCAYRGDSIFSQQDLVKIRQILEEKRLWLKMQGIDFYFIMPPFKHSIYPEFLPPILKKRVARNKRDQVMEYLKLHSDINLIDPLEMLLKKKDSVEVYYSTDTHWNQIGSFFAYRMIIHKIREQHPEMIPWKLSDFEITRGKVYDGDILEMADIKDLYFRRPYFLRPLIARKAEPHLEVHEMEGEASHMVITQVDTTLPRMLMLHDSFGLYLRELMAEHFSFSGYSYCHTLWPERVRRDKPDVVVLEMMERFVNRLLNENPDEIRRALSDRDQPLTLGSK